MSKPPQGSAGHRVPWLVSAALPSGLGNSGENLPHFFHTQAKAQERPKTAIVEGSLFSLHCSMQDTGNTSTGQSERDTGCSSPREGQGVGWAASRPGAEKPATCPDHTSMSMHGVLTGRACTSILASFLLSAGTDCTC